MSTGPGPNPPPQLAAEDVAGLVAAHPRWWEAVEGTPDGPPGAPGVSDPRPDDLVVSVLGRGESYTAWRVARGDQELAVRVPHAPLEELPQPLAAEHDLLDRVPAGVGARPVAVHEPTVDDPAAYLVTSVVRGTVLPPTAWDDELVAALARVLARLHVLGRTDGMPTGSVPDLVAAARSARTWWAEHEPEHAASLEPLWPGVLAHQERVQAAAPEAETVLVHGDACLTNVVVADGRPRLIDWEWAGTGDPARDLAYTGGRVHADPWYAALDDSRVRRQVEAYAAARSALGRPVEVEPLMVRRAGWLVQETFFVVPHLRRVAARGGPGGEGYARRADELLRRLTDWLG